MSNLDHLCIRASAGSGKTHALTDRYLQLIAAGAKPSSLLASTFTRVAAGQIRDKVLFRLAEATLRKDKLAQIATALGRPDIAPDQVRSLLAVLARNMHMLQIRTLDSFFASIVRAFSLELGLAPGSRILDDDIAASMRAEAVRLMLDEQDPQKLVDLLRRLTEDDSGRAVTQRIDDVVANLYALWREAGPEAWDTLPQLQPLKPDEVDMAVQRLASCSLPIDRRIQAAHRKSVQEAKSGRWDDFVTGGYAAAILNRQLTYYSKPIDPALEAAYRPLIEHARCVILNRIRARTHAIRDLLALFHTHYESFKRTRKAMTFEDVTHAMSAAAGSQAGADIGFRIDGRLQHLLLDEFQDTSILQWRALEPIATEIIANVPPDHTFFCVGDVKQSIYGWRSACPEILESIPSLLSKDGSNDSAHTRDLTHSWRSSPIVIEAVNTVFGDLPSNPALEKFRPAAEQWARGFKTHEAVPQNADLPGNIALLTAPETPEGKDRDAMRVQHAAQLVATLHRKAPHLTIGVLTRKNTTIGSLLSLFSADQLDIPASGSSGGGAPLTDSAAVCVLLDALTLADHPANTIAAFNVATSPLGEVLGLMDPSDERQRESAARQVRRSLVNDGYAETVARWVRRIGSFCDQRELRRLAQLIELADVYDAERTLRADDFIKLVESRPIADPSPAPVRVMTIHKAKGLEFDIVVLPELESQLSDEAGRALTLVTDRDGTIGPVRHVCPRIRRELRPLLQGLPHIEAMMEGHTFRQVRESLSLLYVALTRAKQGLYIIVDPRFPGRRTETLSGVLRSAMHAETAGPNQTAFSSGDESWLESARSAPIKPEPERHPAADLSLPIRLAPSSGVQGATPSSGVQGATPVRRGIAAEAASSLARVSHGSLVQTLLTGDSDARDRGVVIHALMELIEWIEDFNDADPAVAQRMLQLAQARAPRRTESWIHARITDFRAAIRQPQIAQLLSRANAIQAAPSGSTLHVSREHRFARLVDGCVQSGTIDRVVITRGPSGQAVHALIVDFKTDQGSPEQAQQIASGYRPQIEAYLDVVSRSWDLPLERIQAVLGFLSMDCVVLMTPWAE